MAIISMLLKGGQSFLQVSFHNQHNVCKQIFAVLVATSTKIQYGYMVLLK